MKKSLLALSLASLLTPGLASADNIAVGVYAGTSGLGLGATYNLTDAFNLRGTVNYFDYDYDTTVDDLEYELDLKLSTLELLLDWHPLRGGFRVSGGLIGNGNELSGTGRARSGTTVEFGDQLFTAAELGTIDATVDFRSVVPYIGIGYGNLFQGSRLSFTADLGVMFQGSPSARIRTNPPAGVDPEVAARIEAARATEEASLEDELKRFRHYPIARVGLAYRF
ncbi:hypothetical protein [Pseudomonas sp.]|uniref:hypothetical protein n=1 Tax=Pseudomonas sp. TaxID=306 RepID=UPI00272A5114|nr:hypothetical protein [Pseudomonas sp.]